MSCSIWSTQDDRVAHDHAHQRDRAEHRDEAERHVEHSRNRVTPISPSGAVSTTSSTRGKLRSWIISTVNTTSMNSGTPGVDRGLALGAFLDRAADLQQITRRKLRAQRLQLRHDLRRHRRRRDASVDVAAHGDRRQAVAAPDDAFLEAVVDVGDLRAAARCARTPSAPPGSAAATAARAPAAGPRSEISINWSRSR